MELVDRNTISVTNREIAEIGKEKERWGSQVDDIEAANYTLISPHLPLLIRMLIRISFPVHFSGS